MFFQNTIDPEAHIKKKKQFLSEILAHIKPLASWFRQWDEFHCVLHKSDVLQRKC